MKKSRKVNGNAPFSKPFFTSKVGGLNRLDWVGMLCFRHIIGTSCKNNSIDYMLVIENYLTFSFAPGIFLYTNPSPLGK